MKHPRTYIKAIAGALFGATAAGLGNAMADGDLTRPEAVAAVGLGLVAGAGVYWSPKNADS